LQVLLKPAPPPPFWDWARIPSRLVWESGGRVRLEGRGRALDLGLGYSLSPEGGSLDLTRGPVGIGLGFSPRTFGLSVRYHPQPYALEGFASTAGELRLGGSLSWGGVRLAGHLGVLPVLGLQSLQAGYQGKAEDLTYTFQAGYQGGVGRLEAGLGQGGLRGQAFWDTRGAWGARGVAALGGGWNLGAGFRQAEEAWVEGVLGVPVWGTLELRGEYGLATGRYRVHLSHVDQNPQEGLTQQLSWDGGALSLGGDYRFTWERIKARAGFSLALGKGGQARLALEEYPWSLAVQAQLGGDLRPTGFSLAAAWAFDLPLFPMPWPSLELVLEDPEGRPVAASLVVGPYAYQAGSDGRLALRLPPGDHVLRAQGGLAFVGGSGLSREVSLRLDASQRVRLVLVPAQSLTLGLRYCPPRSVDPDRAYGLPGLSPEAALAQARVRALVGNKPFPLSPGRPLLLPQGEVALALAPPLEGAYALADLEGRPLNSLRLEGDATLTLCLTPIPRPMEWQELILGPKGSKEEP
ncbi:hypothetical protein, partial [Thermus sp.]|uniref:hypothetical protein n=1 Tax=Thermus sp. TaxID=275 RepID=UPI00298F2E93